MIISLIIFTETILHFFQLNMITNNIYDFNTVTQVAVINLNFACLVVIHFNVLFLLFLLPFPVNF